MFLAINDLRCILLHFHKVTRTTGGQTRAPPLTCRCKLSSRRVNGTCTTLGQKKNPLGSGANNMVKTFCPHSFTCSHLMRTQIIVIIGCVYSKMHRYNHNDFFSTVAYSANILTNCDSYNASVFFSAFGVQEHCVLNNI